MSKLHRADYTEHLAGKTIKRVHWYNDEKWRRLTLEFTDQTLCSFRFEFAVDEEAELSDFASGSPSKHRKLIPLPLVRHTCQTSGVTGCHSPQSASPNIPHFASFHGGYMTTQSLALSENMECPLCLGEGKLKRSEVLDRLGVKDFARVAQLSAEEAFRLLQQKHTHDHHDAWARFETELDEANRRDRATPAK